MGRKSDSKLNDRIIYLDDSEFENSHPQKEEVYHIEDIPKVKKASIPKGTGEAKKGFLFDKVYE